MGVDEVRYQEIVKELALTSTRLVAVSKTKSVEDIRRLYELGQRDFGENYVQELTDKASQLPGDIRWHFIGHLQTNKVKYIAPFIHLVHVVDSIRLLQEIDKQARRNARLVECLFQVHIAREETKFGFDERELNEAMTGLQQVKLANVKAIGLMGMASFTEDKEIVRSEFRGLKILFDKYGALTGTNFTTLSMGMSADYKIAVQEGSNLVRIGSLLFGARS